MSRKLTPISRPTRTLILAGAALATAGSLAATQAHASIYVNTIATQTPLLHWSFDEPTNDGSEPVIAAAIDNLDALLGVGVFVNSARLGPETIVGVPSLEPGSGFDGFTAGNTGFNFNINGPGSGIFDLTAEEESMGMDAGTLSMWVRSTNPNEADPFNSGVLYRGDEGGGDILNFRMLGGSFSLALQDSEIDAVSVGTSFANNYADGNWHHVTAAWSYDIGSDAGELAIFVNGGSAAGGEEVSTTFDSAAYPDILQESDPVLNPGVFDDVMDFDFRHRLGKGRNNGMRYSGDMDEVSIWNRVLSPSEIQAQYEAAFIAGGTPGDFNADTIVDASDVDLLTAAIRTGSSDPQFDLDGSTVVDSGDLDELITTILGTVAGDANLDLAVDLIDLSALASNFNQTAGWAGGNFNTDTLVDLIDLSLLATNFGSTSSIPTPATASLMGLAAAGLLRRNR
ncbi:MAG: LamG-like jellyroll fold domain-containing protein [Phycisphaeraceae bacterium]